MMAKWSTPLEELADRTNRDLHEVVMQSAMYLFRRVIMMSPVDTGRFRANWNCSLQSPDLSTAEKFDQGGGMTINNMESIVLSMDVGQTVYLTNSLPYAVRLEYGWSKQAPSGMVRTSVAEFNSAINRAIRNLRTKQRGRR